MHWRLPILSFLVVLFLGLCAHARPVQVVDDRQYTLGMVIINTPRVNDVYNAPGNLPISLDVGGNGNIQPGSSDTRFASIQLYLINRPNRVNITISGANARVVDQEPGSTVKHVTYNLPNCLPAGPYELALYETGVYENTPYFTITTVPIELRSSAPSGPNASFSCVSPAVTALIAGEQPDRPLPFSPWAPGAARRPPIQQQEEDDDDGPDDKPDPTTTANANPQPLPTRTSSTSDASQSIDTSTPSSTQSTGGPTSESTNGPTPNPTTPEPGEATQDGGTRDGQSGTTDNQTDPTQPLDTPIPEQMPVIASGGFIVPVAAEESAALALRRPRIGLSCTAFLLSFALVLL